MSVRGLALKADNISPSTVARIENPNAPGSPSVETLEALAVALTCPLAELLGESVEVESFDTWPEALQMVVSERGGFVPGIERAYIEYKLSTSYGPLNPARDDLYAWRAEFALFRSSKLWQIIARLAGDDGQALADRPNMLPVIEEVINQFVTVATAPAVVLPGRCTKIIRAGTRCKRRALPGLDTCRQHKQKGGSK